jgi:GTPase SAR1 family protein
MSRRRREHLDALERRLTGPRRLALFGHRAVGKTTLLAMFYREASAGRVPGVRLAAGNPGTAEYLAETIASIEAGEPPPGTLAETALQLRLYHGPARFDLDVRDYQGEHTSLGSDAPVRAFFADCDAVLLCLDPEATADPAVRRRRQQEVEELLERYIEGSADGTAGRPVALVVTKYDRVLAAGGPGPEGVEDLVASRYGMTVHTLAQHAPRSAVFAVSAFGRDAVGDRPPAELHPLGLEGPLVWVAEQLEALDREALEWLWDLAPDDLPRLDRCVAAYERRYPRSGYVADMKRRLRVLRRRRRGRALGRAALGALALLGGVALYDAIGYRAAVSYERANPATAVGRRWGAFVAWHPTHRLLFPAQAADARKRLQTWTVKAAAQQVAAGTAAPDLAATLETLKEQAPELAGDIRAVEAAEAGRRQEGRWRALEGAEAAGDASPEAQLASYRGFLREFPDSPHRAEALGRAAQWEARLADAKARTERQELETLARDAALPDADLAGIVERVRHFLDRNPSGTFRGEAEALLEATLRRVDEADIQEARDFSRSFPTNYPTRLRKYQEYLATHRDGGRFVREALDAIDRIDRDRERSAYRLAYDHARARPDDVPEVARRLQSYLDAHPKGRYADAARTYVKWWDSIRTDRTYKVTLKNGYVEPSAAKTFSGGGPDLAVEIWVAGVKYGPTPVAANTINPIWNYTFPRPVRWKYGDPVAVRIVDHDWTWRQPSGVFRINSPKGEPLAMRYLSGELRPSQGGRTKLVFASDFTVPTLPAPE